MITKPKSVTIELTSTQRARLHAQGHSTMSARDSSARRPLAVKSAPRTVLDSPERSGPSAPGVPVV